MTDSNNNHEIEVRDFQIVFDALSAAVAEYTDDIFPNVVESAEIAETMKMFSEYQDDQRSQHTFVITA